VTLDYRGYDGVPLRTHFRFTSTELRFCGEPGRPRRPPTSASHITSRVTILAANDEEAKERKVRLATAAEAVLSGEV
jgi:hypothetical protein